MGCKWAVPIEQPKPTKVPELENALMYGKAVLGYWKSRGAAQGIRFLLIHLKIQFLDKMYEESLKEDGLSYTSDWETTRQKIGIQFETLPYYIDNHIKLGGALAIYTYICKKHKPEFLGRNSIEKARVFAVVQHLIEFERVYYEQLYLDIPKRQNFLVVILEKAKELFGRIAFEIRNRKFVASVKQPTFVDFWFYEYLSVIEDMDPGITYGISSKLEKYKVNFEKLSGMKKAIVEARKLSYNRLSARWGSPIVFQ